MNEKDKKDLEEFKKIFKNHGCKKYHGHAQAGGGIVYCLGVIGSAIYFVSHATGFWVGVLGLLKSLVWPAFLVYEALNVLIK